MTEENNDLANQAWFKRPLNVFWLLLAIASFGLFAPSFLAFKKCLKAAKWIAMLTFLSLIVSALIDTAYALLGIWLVALLLSIFLKSTVEKKVKQPKVKATAEDKAEAKKEAEANTEALAEAKEEAEAKARAKAEAEAVAKTEALAKAKEKAEAKAEAEAKAIEKIESREKKKEEKIPSTKLSFGQWLHYKSKVAPQVKMLVATLKNELTYQENLIYTRDRFKDLILSINPDALGSAAERTIFETSGCGLIEVRKGARVTHRESSYSGSSSGGSVRVGRVSVGGGSSSGSSSSTSISYPAPDELTMIDDGGRFIITNLKVSYSGSMFTKTTDFKKIVDFQYNGRQLLIAPRTGSKVWIIQFELLEELWIAATLVGVAHEMDDKRLDAKVVTEYGDAATAVKFAFERKLFEVQLAYEESVKEIKLLRQRHADFMKLFPTKVKNLDF